MKADIRDFIWYNHTRGVEGLHIWGFPGSGKTNLGLTIAEMCLKETKDKVLLRGDRFCEWRHYLYNGFRMRFLIPQKAKEYLHYVNLSLEKFAEEPTFSYHYFDHETFNIIEELLQTDILVIYDACFSLPARGWFWAKIFEQLVDRTKLENTVITYLDSEAGILYPEIALSESKKSRGHWRAVNKVCELFVDFRKGLIRPILISQLEGEINHRIRQKCLFNIIKQGLAGKGFPRGVVKEAPRQRVDQYTIAVGKQLFVRFNTTKAYPEDPYIRKLICKQVIGHLDSEPNGHNKPTHGCLNCGYSWIAKVEHPKSCPKCKTYSIEPFLGENN